MASKGKTLVIALVLSCLILGALVPLAIRMLNPSAPSGVARGWNQEWWADQVSPPIFNKVERNLERTDFTWSQTSDKEERAVSIETRHGGFFPGDEKFDRCVHAIAVGDPAEAAVSLSNGTRVIVEYVAFEVPLGDGKAWRKVYRMPGWDEVHAPETVDDRAVESLVRRWGSLNDWESACQIVYRTDGPKISTARHGVLDLQHGVKAGSRKSSGGVLYDDKTRGFVRFDLYSRFPTPVALSMDVYHDFEFNIPMPKGEETVTQGGFEMQVIGSVNASLSMPVETNEVGESRVRNGEPSGMSVIQHFSGSADDGRTAFFFNVRPFVRQDAIFIPALRKNSKRGPRWVRRSSYRSGAPSRAPFNLLAHIEEDDVYPAVTIARRIERVTIPLGTLPFEEWSGPMPKDLLDVRLPLVSFKGDHDLKKSIGRSTGLSFEIDRSLYDEVQAIPDTTFENTTPREVLDFTIGHLGHPIFDREEGTLLFRKSESRLIEWWGRVKTSLQKWRM